MWQARPHPGSHHDDGSGGDHKRLLSHRRQRVTACAALVHAQTEESPQERAGGARHRPAQHAERSQRPRAAAEPAARQQAGGRDEERAQTPPRGNCRVEADAQVAE